MGELRMKQLRCTEEELRNIRRMNLQVVTEDSLGFSKLHLVQGCLWMETGEQEMIPCYVQNGHCFWKRNLKEGNEETGVLRLYDHGFYGEGIVLREGKPVKFQVVSTSAYAMKTIYEGKEVDCGTYKMGYEKQEGRFVAVGEWWMPYEDEAGEMQQGEVASTASQDITYYINEHRQLAGKVRFPALARYQFPFLHHCKWEEAEFCFDTSFQSIQGRCTAVQNVEKTYVLHGELEAETQEKLRQFQQRIQGMSISNQVRISPQECSELNTLLQHSVLDLYNLPQPEDLSQVHQECFQKMMKMVACAAYKTGNEIKDYIGIAEPKVCDVGGDLTCAQGELAKANKDFLLNDLGIAYLSYAYSQNEQEKIHKPITDIPQYNEKIRYYMQGKDKGCMSQTEEYQKITNVLYRQIYMENVVGLESYVGEQGEQDWARQLYEYCNSPQILNGLILTNMVDPENTRINHLCTMLDALDSSPRVTLEIEPDLDHVSDTEKLFSFSVALRKQVMDLTFKYTVKNIKLPDPKDAESVDAFNQTLVAFIEIYFKNLQEQTFTNWTPDIYKEAYQELEEAAQASQYDTVEKYIANIADVVADTTAAILQLENPDMPTAIVSFFDSHPKVSRAFCAAFYITGITSLIFGFREWNKLDTKERTELITSTCAIGLQVVNDLTSWKACGVFRQAYGNLQAANSQITQVVNQADFTKTLAGSKDLDTALTDMGVDMARVTQGERDIMASASKWMKISRIGATAAKVASSLLMAVTLGFQIFETVKDFQTGQPIAVEVMDIIQDVAGGVCFLVEAGSGIAALCGAQVCAVVPVVGLIFAVVGIIVSIVSIFIHRKEPETPVERFIKNQCVPFVERQTPTQEWLDEQEKIAEHLSGAPKICLA